MLLDQSKVPSCHTPAPVTAADLIGEGRPLTIHRLTVTHHGRALRILGHAAEHLTAHVAFCTEARLAASDLEAMALCARLGREVFEEYAGLTERHRPMTDWLIRQANRIYGAA